LGFLRRQREPSPLLDYFSNFTGVFIMPTAADFEKQVFTVQFEYLTLEIRYDPYPFCVDIEHYEIITIDPERSPHPMSETGYKSLFIHPKWTKDCGGAPQDFISFALEEAAKKPAWKDYLAGSRQLSLF
jgi:hypothetical protein